MSWLNLRRRPGLWHSNDHYRSFFVFLHSYLTIFAKQSHHVWSHWSPHRNGHFAHGNGQFMHWNRRFIHRNCQSIPHNDAPSQLDHYPLARNRYGHWGHRSDHLFHHFHHRFNHPARNIWPWRQNEQMKGMFRAQLRAYNFGHNQGELALCIVNVDQGGQLGFIQNDGLFGVDGWVARTLESIPYVGFSIAILHRKSGEEDRFRRAMIHASGSTLVAVLGSIGGHYGGPIGAAFVAAVSTPLKMLLEQWAGIRFIRDPLLRQEFENVTLGKYLIESVANMIAAGTSSEVSRFFKQQLAHIIEAITYPLLQVIGKWVVNKAGNTINSTLVHKTIEGLMEGTLPPELLASRINPNQLQLSSYSWDRNGNWIGDAMGETKVLGVAYK
ncbi:hypothetical protein C8R45DRAFT_995086 [Mycena sanguinolenta]|nr:hypothetical protein C8R45DRAFT_995086 [Mycena sanguinolenta]